MTSAVHGSGFVWDLGYESVTKDSRAIQDACARERNYLQGSASDWLPIVGASLRGIRKDCSHVNWDGSDAHPVSDRTINLAADIANVLFTLLPTGTPVPDLIPEADGEICMSWSVDVYRMFSLSIGTHGRINFAGQFGNKGSIHGWQPIDATTHHSLEKSLQETVRHIRQLYDQAAIKRHSR